VICRNCGRSHEHHDDEHCKRVHLGGVPRPPPRDPADPSNAPAFSIARAAGEVLITGAIRPVRLVAIPELGVVAAFVDGRCVGRITLDAARAVLDELERALAG
jgi:hypothetical protein